jgi:hypothetical protein
MIRAEKSFVICFVTTLLTPVFLVLAKPSAAVLELPFDKIVIFTNGESERTVSSGIIEGQNIILKQVGRPDLILPWSQIKAILPVLPKDEIGSVEDLQNAIFSLKESRDSMPSRSEVSDQSIQSWQNRVDRILQRQANEKKQQLAKQEAEIQRAALEQAVAEKAAEEAEKSRQIDIAKGKVVNYQGFRTRQEVEEATQACGKLDKSDLAIIPDYEKASEFWKRCLALPVDVAMPGGLEGQKELAVALAIDPSAHGSALTALAWVLFFVPLMVALHGLTRFLALLQERAWVGAGLWFGISGAAGICLFLLFFSERGSGVEAASGSTTETRAAWVALANAKDKEVTRFEEKIEIPLRVFLQKIVGSMKNPEVGSTAWVPTLTRLPAVGGDSGIEIGIEVPLKWITLPVRVSFADPLPDQEVLLKAAGAKIGPFSVGASGGAWIWEQIAPVYQGVVAGLGLDQGVKLILLNSEKLVVSIPEVRAKLKPSP